jgi:RHS repeat-associated protein
VPQTKVNYTGQKLDGTGLLYYHARYYDPTLARFVSPDSIVPDEGQCKLSALYIGKMRTLAVSLAVKPKMIAPTKG